MFWDKRHGFSTSWLTTHPTDSKHWRKQEVLIRPRIHSRERNSGLDSSFLHPPPDSWWNGRGIAPFLHASCIMASFSDSSCSINTTPAKQFLCRFFETTGCPGRSGKRPCARGAELNIANCSYMLYFIKQTLLNSAEKLYASTTKNVTTETKRRSAYRRRYYQLHSKSLWPNSSWSRHWKDAITFVSFRRVYGTLVPRSRHKHRSTDDVRWHRLTVIQFDIFMFSHVIC